MSSIDCPSSETIDLYLKGDLSDPQMITIEQHLCHCNNCVERLQKSQIQEIPERFQNKYKLTSECISSDDSAEIFLDRLKSITPWKIPKSIEKFQIIRLISQGGNGEVYECVDHHLDRHVALKTIRPQMLSLQMMERFQNEAKIQARLSHENIVQVMDYGVSSNEMPYLVMELVEGGTLRDRIRKGKLAEREAAWIIEKCASAVAYAHNQGVLHRDLKPSNILIARARNEINNRHDRNSEFQFTPKITDFGLAKVFADSNHITASGILVGTPIYMAPEQAKGGMRNLRVESDIYALGVILYECLTGKPPFESDQVSTILRMIQEFQPVSPRSIVPELSRDMETICLKCLEKEPSRRYHNGQELAEDLRNLQLSEPIKARRLGILGKSYRWCERNQRLSLSILISLILLISLLVFVNISFLIQSNLIQHLNLEASNLINTQIKFQREWDKTRNEFYGRALSSRNVIHRLNQMNVDADSRIHLNTLRREIQAEFDERCFLFFQRAMSVENPRNNELESLFRDAIALRDLEKSDLAIPLLEKIVSRTRGDKVGNKKDVDKYRIWIQCVTVLATFQYDSNRAEEAIRSMKDVNEFFQNSPELSNSDAGLAHAKMAMMTVLQDFLTRQNREMEANTIKQEISHLKSFLNTKSIAKN